MKKFILILLALILGITGIFYLGQSSPTPNNLLTEYKYSQYCLSGYRTQHGWDKLIPQYGLWCNGDDDYRGMMDDPELYTLAGTLYLKRADPASINPESQPLAKYLFGGSTVLFDTPLIAQYLAFAVITIALYLVSKKSMGKYWSLLPPILFMLDGLVREQLVAPYLDLILTAFALLFLLNLRSPRRAMLLIALASLAKSFSIGIVMGGALHIYLLATDKSKITTYLKQIWIGILVYLAGYTAFFFYHQPLDFLTLHIDILRFYKSYVPEYPRGEILRIIYTGQWRSWYGDKGLIPAPGWSLLWPLSVSVSLISLLVAKLRKNPIVLPHLIWIMTYLAFISLRLVFPRYLLPILPSLYLVLVLAISNLSSYIRQNIKK